MNDPATLANRFGYGVRPGVTAGSDAASIPRQFDRFAPRPGAFASAPTRAVVAKALADYLEEARAVRQANPGARRDTAGAAPMPMVADLAKEAMKQARRYAARTARDDYVALVGARTNAVLQSEAPFVERMVHFWSNHFAISIDKLQVVGLGGLLEVEAIRANVLGKFSDMLLAVEQHPAMLLYLDQAQSVGPDSPLGRRVAARGKRKLGLNENLAREIMELHTLGVRSGYSQGDVTEFARALTGWTVAGLARQNVGRLRHATAAAGDFIFADALHQPGDRTIMNRRYPAGGEEQARAVLLDLARAPATANHIAVKLARHFAGDASPPSLVQRLSASFTASGGDLPTLYSVLASAPELAGGPAKFKSPWDWSVSALRAVGTREVEGRMVVGLQTQLGQQVWKPGSPAGYDDSDAAWAAPDALMRRVEAASRIAAKIGNAAFDPRAVAAKVLPAGGSKTTLEAIARAETPTEGLTMMLVAPEFMRR
jgi:uncharacterized protein (DUF1800 family)